jgi:hypothetical protein
MAKAIRSMFLPWLSPPSQVPPLPRASARAAAPVPMSSTLTPDPSSSSNTLTGVSAESATDAWAVGDYLDDATGAQDTLILHWDGDRWSRA